MKITFDPFVTQLKATERLRILNGKLCVEDIAIRKKSNCFSRLFTRHEYSQQRILKKIQELGNRRIKDKNIPQDAVITLLKNYQELIQRAEKQNALFKSTSCLKRWFQGKSNIHLTVHQKAIQTLLKTVVPKHLEPANASINQASEKLSTLDELEPFSHQLISTLKEVEDLLKEAKKHLLPFESYKLTYPDLEDAYRNVTLYQETASAVALGHLQNANEVFQTFASEYRFTQNKQEFDAFKAQIDPIEDYIILASTYEWPSDAKPIMEKLQASLAKIKENLATNEAMLKPEAPKKPKTNPVSNKRPKTKLDGDVEKLKNTLPKAIQKKEYGELELIDILHKFSNVEEQILQLKGTYRDDVDQVQLYEFHQEILDICKNQFVKPYFDQFKTNVEKNILQRTEQIQKVKNHKGTVEEYQQTLNVALKKLIELDDEAKTILQQARGVHQIVAQYVHNFFGDQVQALFDKLTKNVTQSTNLQKEGIDKVLKIYNHSKEPDPELGKALVAFNSALRTCKRIGNKKHQNFLLKMMMLLRQRKEILNFLKVQPKDASKKYLYPYIINRHLNKLSEIPNPEYVSGAQDVEKVITAKVHCEEEDPIFYLKEGPALYTKAYELAVKLKLERDFFDRVFTEAFPCMEGNHREIVNWLTENTPGAIPEELLINVDPTKDEKFAVLNEYYRVFQETQFRAWFKLVTGTAYNNKNPAHLKRNDEFFKASECEMRSDFLTKKKFVEFMLSSEREAYPISYKGGSFTREKITDDIDEFYTISGLDD